MTLEAYVQHLKEKGVIERNREDSHGTEKGRRTL
jgi:hypothetical protein